MTTRPRILIKYVDDIFAIVQKDKLTEITEIFNNFNRNIKFTVEEEDNDQIAYLDTKVIKHDNTIKVNWYQKEMASGRLINYFSNHTQNIKMNTARNFVSKVLSLSDEVFHKENIRRIYEILDKNDFPRHIIRQIIQEQKHKIQNNQNTSTEKKTLIHKTVTNVKGLCGALKRAKIFDDEKIRLAVKSNQNVGRLYSNLKSGIKDEDKSDLVYEIKCNGDGNNMCNKVYIGTTKTKLKTRISAHKSDQRKRIDETQKTALADHCTKAGHNANFDDVRILQQETHYNKRMMLEMLHIINVPKERRINFKADVDNRANAYRHLIRKTLD